MSFQAVLFDLDGTLVDTAPDFVPIVNAFRHQRNQAPLRLSDIRPFVSHGATRLLEETVGVSDSQTLDAFLDAYHATLAQHSQLFPGMAKVLAHLSANNIAWGVVTNKPERFTLPLLKGLSLETAVTVSGDTLSKKKPNPEPIWHACEHLSVSPSDTLYIGDAERDIQAGARAGTKTAVALFGYLSTQDEPHQWNANHHLATPLDIIEILD